VEQLRKEVEVIRAQLEKERAKKELSSIVGISNLPYLVAMSIGPSADESAALVMDERGSQKWVKVGDELENGAKVVSIDEKGVRVKEGGKRGKASYLMDATSNVNASMGGGQASGIGGLAGMPYMPRGGVPPIPGMMQPPGLAMPPQLPYQPVR